MNAKQEVALQDRFAKNAKDFAAWCRETAHRYPHAKAFYLSLAKKAEREARELRRAA